MRHGKAGKRLGRTGSHKKAMVRNMVTSLFEHERIVTTTPKAKEVRNPEREYFDSFYRDAEGFISFPAGNIKQAIVNSARNVDGLPMTLLRGALFVKGDLNDMIQVLCDGKALKPSKKVNILRAVPSILYMLRLCNLYTFLKKI